MYNKEIILHVGVHKTGTTSIQQALYNKENLHILEKNNMEYIHEFPPNNGVIFWDLFSPKNMIYKYNILFGYTEEEIQERAAVSEAILRRYLLNDKKLIISGEAIGTFEKEQLLNAKKYLESSVRGKVKIKIVICLRNPIAIISSLYQQRIKNGIYFESSNEFIEEIKQTYRCVKDMTDIFGAENLIVYSFEKACSYEDGLVSYFFKEIGLDNIDRANLKETKENESFSAEAAKVSSYINKKECSIVENKRSFNRKLADLDSLIKINGSKFILDRNEILKIYKYIFDDLVWIKDNYGIDYTNQMERIMSIVEVENEYEELSVVEAFNASSEFVRKTMIEYYKINNERLYNILSDIEKRDQVYFDFKNCLEQKNTLEYIKIVNFDQNNKQYIKFKRRFGNFTKITDNLYKVEFSDNESNADCLRELALCLEEFKEIELALKYMSMAKILRFNGEFLAKKCEEYKVKLGVEK